MAGRRLGPLFDPAVTDGGRVALRGDVTGPSDANVVETLTGTGGFVTLPATSTLRQTQTVADLTMVPLQLVTAGGVPFYVVLQGAGVDDTLSIGPNAKNVGGAGPCSNYTWENNFVGAFEAYQEFNGTIRPWFASCDRATSATVVVLECSGDQGVVVQDFTAGVAVGIASFQKASCTLTGGTCNLGADATTTQTNLHASLVHYRTIGGVVADQLNLAGGTSATVDVNAPIAFYGIVSHNAAGLYMQSNGGGVVQLDGTNGYLTSGGANVGRWIAAGFQFFAAPDFGGGVGVIGIANRTTAPTTNPAGSIEYAEAGATKIRGAGGTLTTIAPA